MSLKRFVIAILFILAICATQVFTQEGTKPTVAKGVYWSDSVTGVEAYLVPRMGTNSFRLTVISSKEVKVTYRTRINSVEPVVKELTPVATSGAGVRYYEFEHYFSKMTIWMGLEFIVDGKKIPALTRVFYDNIFEIAPANMYPEPK
ncbi:MAG TPA: hypothetical protein VJS44_12770 [Pyrinomonadaceae bacterium]|nr:hypothetical protein [Pyrinomonadaceae bacterium]